MADFDMIVIGSEPAGQKAAIQAAKFRRRVALVERRHMVGGVCTNTGTIPSKTLRTVFNYPTLAESYKVAALDAANKLHHLRRVSA